MLIRHLHKNMTRQLIQLKFFGRRKNFLILLSLFILALYTCSWLAIVPSERIQSESHVFHKNKTFAHYVDRIQVLVEPSSETCEDHEEILVIVLVASAPDHFNYRQAIRRTWGKYQQPLFVLGLYGDEHEKQLDENRKEANDYNDLIVFNFNDHYKNSSLKTALMIHWTLEHCPQAEFMMKTVDDVLVNPWTLRSLLVDHHGTQLLGYVHRKKLVFSDEYNMWYYWVYNVDLVPMYLSGNAYFINGKHLDKMLSKAYEAPLINLEDIYFTYVVAYRGLGMNLQHDWRLNPKRPMFYIPCAYWTMVSTHGYTPKEMVTAWTKIEDQDQRRCSPFLTYLLENEWLLM